MQVELTIGAAAEQVRRLLPLAHLSQPEALGIIHASLNFTDLPTTLPNARAWAALSELTKRHLTPPQRRSLIVRLAQVAERARIAAPAFSPEGVDPHELALSLEVTISSFLRRPSDDSASTSAAAAAEEDAIALCIYALGRGARAHARAEQASSLLRHTPDEDRKGRGITAATRWPAFSTRQRSDDVSYLLAKQVPEIRHLAKRLLRDAELSDNQKSALVRLRAGQPARTDGDADWAMWCFRVLFSDELTVLDLPNPAGDDALDFVSAVNGYAVPRVGIARAEAALIPIHTPALSDAVLLAAAKVAGEVRKTEWHEREVSTAAEKSLSAHALVVRNVLWGRQAGGPPARVDGEIDVIGTSDCCLFDVQAKAPVAETYTSRVNTLRTDAGKQHDSLHEAMITSGVALWVDSPRRLPQAAPRVIPSHSLLHVPISVGLEPAPQFSIGGNRQKRLTPRVETTLDHIRVVNTVVPALFRPVYWLDRLALECRPLAFVDEIDALDRWLKLLNGQDVVIKHGGNNAFATQSHIEGHLSLSSGLYRSKLGRRDLEQTRIGTPAHRAPQLMRLLERFAKRRTPGLLPLLFSLVAFDFEQLEKLSTSNALASSGQVRHSLRWRIANLETSRQIIRGQQRGDPPIDIIVGHDDFRDAFLWRHPVLSQTFSRALLSGQLSRYRPAQLVDDGGPSVDPDTPAQQLAESELEA